MPWRSTVLAIAAFHFSQTTSKHGVARLAGSCSREAVYAATALVFLDALKEIGAEKAPFKAYLEAIPAHRWAINACPPPRYGHI